MTSRTLTIAVTLAALVASLCCGWIDAQKTANSYRQPAGSNPQSVYGGYQTSSANRQHQQSFVAPVNQRRTEQSSYVSRQSVSQPVYQQQQQQQQPDESGASSSSYDQAEADAEPASYGAVAGKPGQDFPAYTRVPKTSFSCDGRPYDYGMYADEETGCQAYHVCYNGRKDSFLCGVGTVFNQRILHCDYWYSVDCGKSSQYYSSNAYMGSSQPEPGPAQAQSQPQPQQAQAQNTYQRNEVSSASVNRPASFQRAQSSSFNRNTQQVQEAY